MTLYIAPIVEGHTEVGCIERLLQRVWNELLAKQESLRVVQPTRGNRDTLIDAARPDLANKVEQAHTKLKQVLGRDAAGRGLLLILLDAERECPKEVAPRLLAMARQSRGDADISCVLAKRMVENWIVAGAGTLAGKNGLPDPLPTRHHSEDFNGADWLKEQLRKNNRRRTYKKTVDAKPFVHAMDLSECRTNSPSFDKLCRELEARTARPTRSDSGSAEADQAMENNNDGCGSP